jgi:hypothetical protein
LAMCKLMQFVAGVLPDTIVLGRQAVSHNLQKRLGRNRMRYQER